MNGFLELNSLNCVAILWEIGIYEHYFQPFCLNNENYEYILYSRGQIKKETVILYDPKQNIFMLSF